MYLHYINYIIIITNLFFLDNYNYFDANIQSSIKKKTFHLS